MILDNFSTYIFMALYSDIIFFIDHYCAGVSNKHCLLPFFSFIQLWVFYLCKYYRITCTSQFTCMFQVSLSNLIIILSFGYIEIDRVIRETVL